MKQLLATLCCLMFMGLEPCRASILQGPASHLRARLGDQLTLRVVVQEGDEIIWLTRGKILGRGSELIFATEGLSFGTHDLSVIAKKPESTDILNIRLDLEQAPLLYKPMNTTVRAQPVNMSYITMIPSHQWQVVVVKGYAVKQGPHTRSSHADMLPPVFPLEADTAVAIGSGSSVVLTKVATQEEVFLDGPAKFQWGPDDQLSISKGKGIWQKYARNGQENPPLDLTRTPLSAKSTSILFSVGDPLGEGRPLDVKLFSPLFREFFPEWFGREIPGLLPMARLGSRSRFQNLDQENLDSLIGRKQWIPILDLTSSQERLNHKENALVARGIAFRELGLYRDSESAFKEVLKQAAPQHPKAAFELGRLFEQTEKLESSLKWYDEAKNSGYEPLSEVLRDTARVLSKISLYRKASDTRVLASWEESDLGKEQADLTESELLLGMSTFQGRVGFKTAVQSHLLPWNHKKAELPVDAATNRGIITSVDMDWRYGKPTTDTVKGYLWGHHLVDQAFVSVPGISRNHHGLGGGLDVLRGPYRLEAKLGLGTKIQGGARQVDEFTGAVLLMRQSIDLLQFGVLMEQVKALDPQPGGADFVDERLNMVTPEGSDHSRFETKAGFVLQKTLPWQWYKAKLTWSSLDFRRGDLDAFDGSEIAVGISYGQRLYKKWRIQSQVATAHRSYKSADSDQEVDFQMRPGRFLSPRWIVEIFAQGGFRTSGIEVLNYSSHQYGFSTEYIF